MKKVMVFGTFDGIHPGHVFFLKSAKALGDRLIVCIARDIIVRELKGKLPERPEIERREAVAEEASVDEVVYGDRELGRFTIVEQVDPDLIALGYDQTELASDLQRWISQAGKSIPIVSLPSLRPDLYKSSLVSRPAGARPGRPSA